MYMFIYINTFIYMYIENVDKITKEYIGSAPLIREKLPNFLGLVI